MGLSNSNDMLYHVVGFQERCSKFHGPNVANSPKAALHLRKHFRISLIHAMLTNRSCKILKMTLITEQPTSLLGTGQLSIEVRWYMVVMVVPINLTIIK